jgi:hypothetical protein
MADVIDYPSNRVKPGCFPEEGDKYQAFGMWDGNAIGMVCKRPPKLCFHSPDLSSTLLFSYDELRSIYFSPAYDDERCMLELCFRCKHEQKNVDMFIIGKQLHGLDAGLNSERVLWIWAAGIGRADVNAGEPVVESIKVQGLDDAIGGIGGGDYFLAGNPSERGAVPR